MVESAFVLVRVPVIQVKIVRFLLASSLSFTSSLAMMRLRSESCGEVRFNSQRRFDESVGATASAVFLRSTIGLGVRTCMAGRRLGPRRPRNVGIWDPAQRPSSKTAGIYIGSRQILVKASTTQVRKKQSRETIPMAEDMENSAPVMWRRSRKRPSITHDHARCYLWVEAVT